MGGTPTLLVGDIGGITERPSWTLGIVKESFEEYEALITLIVVMWWGEKDALLVIETSWSMKSRVLGSGQLKWGTQLSSMNSI